MKYLNTQYDERSVCYSILTEQTLQEYIDIVKKAYDSQGMISGQRDKLSSTSAIRIRKRMIEDFEKKAVFPPVVVGLVVSEDKFKSVNDLDDDKKINELLKDLPSESVSIIDGMQRTTVYLECFEKLKTRAIRVEFWVTTKTESLTYRMLVLNTGQVPWNLRRQIEVVYAPLIKEIEKKLKLSYPDIADKIKLFRIDDKGARVKSGQFHADDVIEMYLTFGLRKEKIDTASVIAEDFTRLDLIEALSNKEYLNDFTTVFASLCKLDLAFDDAIKVPIDKDTGKINIGRNIFDSNPAKIGLTVACSQLIYGRVGNNKSRDEQEKALGKIKSSIDRLLKNISNLKSEQEKEKFFCFSILNEMIKAAPSNRIGDWQRAFFLEGFRSIFSEDFNAESLEPCWRAY
jgi:hypothetical protein